MAKNDEWCELCNDKIKAREIKINNQTLDVCGHCAALAVGLKEEEQ